MIVVYVTPQVTHFDLIIISTHPFFRPPYWGRAGFPLPAQQHTQLLSHQRGRRMTVSGAGFTQRLCRYFVRSVTTQGSPWLPDGHCDCMTAFVRDHCYEDMYRASFRCLPLVFVHGFIYRNEWERYPNTKYHDTGTTSSTVFVACVT